MNKLFVFIFLIFLDLVTKFIVKNSISLNQKLEINIFMDLIYVQNFGVSFGLFSGLVSHWFLIVIGLLVVILIIYLMIFSKNKFEKIAYFVIIIGAISNILDRTINKYVVDFILLHYQGYYWPAFNFADIYITIGIIMLIISFFTKFDKTE